ncbi:unnamed protein product [Ilex paraguariensis]|uniref:F-box domain-containing protein n=1 Tax=Ilex paraguariensis TaxID=185542 RepID=A0ABC8RV36_9AQUA
MERKTDGRMMVGDEKEGRSINNLPDSILLHILSFLEMKYVMRTSVVSKRWEDLWVSVPNLIFSLTESDVKSQIRLDKIMNFVDRILLLHDSPKIQKFSLTCTEWSRCLNCYRFNSWLCSLVKHNVEQLKIDFRMDVQQFKWPKVLVTCKSLVELHLEQKFYVRFPSYVYFPNLKVLQFSVINPRESINQSFFCGFPMLESLIIDVFVIEGTEPLIDISAPKLRKLKIIYADEFDDFPFGHNIKVLINAPNLEHLIIDTQCGPWYLIKNQSSSLVRVEINVELDYYYVDDDTSNRVLVLLKELSDVKHLVLFDQTMRFLAQVNDHARFTFSNVTYLELKKLREVCLYDHSDLFGILQSMPILESLYASLSFTVGDYDSSDEDDDWIRCTI